LKILAIAFALMYFATIFIAQDAFSAAPKKSQKKSLSTSVDFSDRTVGGKYMFSTEAITTVENDKSLDDLIGVRKNFKDRIERSESLR
jgi:hypothetical protein